LIGMDIVFILFPNITQLDLTGPAQVLSRVPDARLHYVAVTEAPVPTDSGFAIVPTCTVDTVPGCDLLCVPGGGGVAPALGDGRLRAFLAEAGTSARYVTSVCTGAFLLGGAGLLQGRRATTHWGYTHLLPLVGATHEPSRVVRDGHVITAGGVTSGIDFGLTLLADIAGAELAQATQLGFEYDPAPPFACGHPDRAPATIRAAVAPRYEAAATRMKEALAALT
jgi:cyclohexyl-isocyanide hydratase